MKTKSLKSLSGMVLAGILALTVTQNVASAQARPNPARRCSNATVRGGYGGHVGATVVPDGTPVAVISRQTFDGKGRWSGSVTINANGTVMHFNDDFGTYAVNADCTGKIYNAANIPADFVLVDGGKEVYFLQTNPPGAVFLFTGAKKQFPDDDDSEDISPSVQARPKLDKRCSNAILEGGYGFRVGATLVPAGAPLAVLGQQNFDGRGNYTATVTINANGSIINATDFGTYTVNADCTGKVLSKAGGTTFEFVLVDGGKESYFLQTDPSASVFLWGVSRKQLP
jgi:hypothetical protein